MSKRPRKKNDGESDIPMFEIAYNPRLLMPGFDPAFDEPVVEEPILPTGGNDAAADTIDTDKSTGDV